MNELSKENTMTVKEVAEALNVSERTIQRHANQIGLASNGKSTYLNQEHVTIIKLRIERSGRTDLDNIVGLPKTELEKDLIIMQAQEILFDRIKVLTEQKEKAESQVKMLVHDFNKCYTTTEISKEMNLKSAQELNNILSDHHIQYKQNGTWVLYSDFSDKGYVSIKETVLDSGKIVYDRQWTGLGRQFILNLFEVK